MKPFFFINYNSNLFIVASQTQPHISFSILFTLLKSGENVQLPSTIVTARLQHVSTDAVVTDSFKHVSVAIHVSSGPCEILYFSMQTMHVASLTID
jgi:hypothetical protein